MKIIFTLFVFLIIYTNLNAQNYAVGSSVISFTDASRSGRQIPANVYYPANVAGANAAFVSGNNKFPLVVFGHGFVIPVSAYEWLADSLVPKGYIVVMPSTEGGLSPSHTDFGNDLLFLCNFVTSLNDSAGSFFYQRVIKKSAVAGHSMGGGSSFLAAANTSSAINAIFNFAAAETNPSAITAASLVNKPALIFSGSQDCIVPAATQQQMYNNITASCKAYINITGALHCQFANNNGTCSLGQLLSGCNTSSINPGIVFNKTGSLLIPFLDYFLKDSCIRGFDYINGLNSISDVTKIISCNATPECGVLPVVIQSFTAGIVNKDVGLQWTIAGQNDIQYFSIEKSADGYLFQSFKNIFPANTTANNVTYVATDTKPFPGNSYYRLKIFNKDGSYKISAIKKVSMPLKNIAIISVAPNPVKNNLQVALASAAIQQAVVSIYSGTGLTEMKASVLLNKGINIKSFSLEMLSAGLYILTVKDGNGIWISSAKFIKE